MGAFGKSCHVWVAVMALVAVLSVPGYSQTKSTDDAKVKGKVAALIEKLKDNDEAVRVSAVDVRPPERVGSPPRGGLCSRSRVCFAVPG